MPLLQSIQSRIRWESEPSLCPCIQHGGGGVIELRRGTFQDGAARGVEAILLDTGAVRLLVLPTRGMGIWRMEADGHAFGWQSPVAGPIHPNLVPTFDPSGLGWLEGFDELLVRCGLESNGAPQHDPRGQLQYPLHGRIANLPAIDLSAEFEPSTGRLVLEGTVLESRLFFKRFQLRSRLTVHVNSAVVEIEDTIINAAAQPATAQMLYHINLGVPLLSDGARIRVAGQQVRGKDERSNDEIDRWDQIGPPETGYAERVYFIDPRADPSGNAACLLQAVDRAVGFGVTFDTQTLPHCVVWKNTAAMEDGYVVGIEPATNLPNTRDEEAAAGRIVSLDPGGEITFRLALHPLVSSAQVSDFADTFAL